MTDDSYQKYYEMYNSAFNPCSEFVFSPELVEKIRKERHSMYSIRNLERALLSLLENSWYPKSFYSEVHGKLLICQGYDFIEEEEAYV